MFLLIYRPGRGSVTCKEMPFVAMSYSLIGKLSHIQSLRRRR
jgi:hypothetical protein